MAMKSSYTTRWDTIRPVTEPGIRFEFEIATAGALTIGRCSYEGRATVDREGSGGSYQLYFSNTGHASFELHGRQIVMSPGQGAIIDGHCQSTNVLRGPCEQLVISIDRGVLQTKLAGKLEILACNDLDFLPEINLLSGPGIAVAHIATTLYMGLIRSSVLRQAPTACANLTNALVDLLLESLPHNYTGALKCAAGPKPRHIKQAIEFMRRNLRQPLTLQEIADAAGVRTRTLQEGFRRFKSTTPMGYLQYLRLDAVHNELIHNPGSKTVSEIAISWGFSHRGRFAADYRKRFGQFPSQTLGLQQF